MCGGSHHPWLFTSLACLMLVTAATAQGQTWLGDRKRAEGIGLRVGDLELHPGIGAEFGYTTNVYNEEDPEELASAALRVSPHLFLSTLTEERAGTDEGQTPGFIRFTGGISATLEHYFADLSPGTDFGTDVNLQLTVAPERPISFTVTEVFRRAFRPFGNPVEDPATPGALPDEFDFVRYYESIGARLNAQTAGGLLQGGLGYRFSYEWFDDEVVAENNNLVHHVSLTGGWEFLPKSALFYEATYAHQDYTNNDEAVTEVGALLEDNDQVTARLGFNGGITPRISATLAAGYSVGFFDENDFEGVTVNVEGRWLPTAISEWALGFERSFGSAYQGNFVNRNNIYTRLRFFFGGAFVLASKLAVEFLEFGPSELDIDEARSDIRYSGDLSGEYRFSDWLALTAQVSGVIDDSDYIARTTFEVDGEEMELDDPVEYKTIEAWIGVRAFY